jgi:hypothetical protein
MDSLDKEIMLALLRNHQSMYSVDKSLKETNYATVYRHIRKMHDDGLLSITKMPRKDGKWDERGTEKPDLTAKGLATLIIEGNLQKEELVAVGNRVMKEDFNDVPASLFQNADTAEIFANTLLKMRHKINLKFFDEAYFNTTFDISFAESIIDGLKGYTFGKNPALKRKAMQLKKKYVGSTQIDGIRNLRRQLIEESNRLARYAEVIGAFLKVID